MAVTRNEAAAFTSGFYKRGTMTSVRIARGVTSPAIN
jgi:hypothetical protein